MTVAQMHTLFKLKLDKSNSLNYPEFEPEEIDLWLNQAQEMFVKTRYGGNNVYGTSAEETQKRADDLKNIVGEVTITNPTVNAGMTNTSANTWSYALPSDYMLSLVESANITYDCEGVTMHREADVKPIQSGAWTSMVRDPFNKPNKERILRVMSNGTIDVIIDTSTTLVSLFLRYYKTPVEIDNVSTVKVDCELSEHTHSEIVDTAVLLSLENIESKRIQSAGAISSKIE